MLPSLPRRAPTPTSPPMIGSKTSRAGPRLTAGQLRLIHVTGRRIGLRDGQVHDLAEHASGFRTRAIAGLTVLEARTLIGVLKRMERHAGLERPRTAAS